MVQLLVESWIWWSLVILVAASRFISRYLTLGSIRKFQADDYLMILILCFYTTLIATINIVRHTSSNLLPPGFDVNTLTKQDIAQRQYGSKLILVVEQCQCCTIWGVKGCLVILYLRITTLRRENIAVKILAAYVVISFIVMDTLYFGVWCQPFHNYWAVPTPNRQCDAATNHLITNAVFNLTSDIAMLAIGLPMFLRMKLPWKKKIPMVGIFSLGIFTILAAILNKVYSFTKPFGAEWTYWYTRESSTALLVANLPFVWNFWRRCVGMTGVEVHSEHNTPNPEHSISHRGSSLQNLASPRTDPFPSLDKEISKGSLGDVGLESCHSPRGGGMSLAEILREEAPLSSGEKEPTPITHPHLFYSRERARTTTTAQSRIEKDALDQADDQVDSNPAQPAGTTPESSNPSTLRTKESASSFV